MRRTITRIGLPISAELRLVGVLASWLVVLVGINSCGGGSGGEGGPSTGTFSDDPVEGLSYASGSQFGETDATGIFHYDDDRITFTIGDIEIGNGDAAEFMTPVDLVRDEDPGAVSEQHEWVTNIARFLQSIDEDRDPRNGIKITQAVRDAAAGRSLEFYQSIVEFETDPNTVAVLYDLTAVTRSGPRGLVLVAHAQEQLRNALSVAAYAGRYSGKFDGFSNRSNCGSREAVGGIWRATVYGSGVASGTVTIRYDNANCLSIANLPATFDLRGEMSPGGQLKMRSGLSEAEGSLHFDGQTAERAVAGSWAVSTFDDNNPFLAGGSFSGAAE